MKKIVSILFFLFMAITMSGNAASYEELWKKVREAGAKDLPKTQYEQLQKIVKKAESERVYGQLLKAELQSMQVMNTISPDSLKPAVERLQQRVSQTADPVLQTVRRTVLYRICKENRSLEMTAEKPVLTTALCQQLGSVKDETMKPFVIEGADSRIFGHDLLSVVGYELEDYAPLHIYYEQQGNREAALFTALELWRQQKNEERKNRLPRMNSACLASLDSLIAVYADLPEAGELALERYDYMEDASGVSSKEKYEYLNSAIEKWGNWPRISQLSNRRARLTTPSFSLSLEHAMAYPQQEQNLELHGVRNVDSVTLTIRRLSVNGDTDLNPSRQEDYAKLMKGASKPLSRITRNYAGKAPYEETEDSIPLMPLSAGVYLFELESAPATEKICRLFYVTDVYTIAQAQPDNTTRYVVVSARTGQPLPDARLYIRQYKNYREYTTSSFRVGKNGEYIYKRPESGRIEVWACTPDDKGCPLQNLRSSYYYNGKVSTMEETCVYTDRAIYRPGQTVHVAAIVYQVANGKDHKALEGKTVTMTLRDANYKEVKQLQLTTDKYGTCSADFTLPQNGLTGRYTLQVNQQMESIRVEEYKRPTFEVSFESVKDNYKAGDTVMARGTAQTYAGVPVQGAKVKYRVERRFAFWWLSYSRYWGGGYFGRDSEKEALCEGETETDEQGAFSVPMPLTMPESEYPLFYTFVAECDVTDQGGETHSNSYSLPLGNRKTALSIGVSEKVLTDSEPSISFHLRNAAGNDMEGTVRYRIDGGKWKTVSTQKSVSIGKMASGTHVVEAIYGDAEIGSTDGNYAKREFVAFSLDDKRPACKTDDWFYLSSTTFPNDGTPITLQAGSSADDVHIVYSIFSGEKVLESGAVDLSNALINRKLTYREDWGNGILLSYAWVKDGRCYQHSQSIRRPLPNKRLNLTWETFRDRLKPGQQEEWTLSIKNPDGTPADAHLIATLYDKSLDQLAAHDWSLTPRTMLALPSMGWGVMGRYSLMGNAAASVKFSTVQDLYFSRFDNTVFPSFYPFKRVRGMAMNAKASMRVLASAPSYDEIQMAETADEAAPEEAVEKNAAGGVEEAAAMDEVQLRENLQETAFFYPQLTTDANGHVALKFTLPESLTTWRFLSVAHTPDMFYGSLSGEAVASKDVMIQPNMPRFVRQGDEAVITARLFNTSDHAVSGKARLQLVNPETDAVVFETEQPFSVEAGKTGNAQFSIAKAALAGEALATSLLVCRVTAVGDGFSDGEQHYLPVLPSMERVTVTRPFTQNEAGTHQIDLTQLMPQGTDRHAPTSKLLLEYTNNPAWLMIQALPYVGKVYDDNAVSLGAAFYANTLGNRILAQTPAAKTAFQLWQQEQGSETSLTSSLEKNADLKDIVLNETPWVMDAENETEQKHRLADFFDENTLQQRRSTLAEKLSKLQLDNGAWTWWPGMEGSLAITASVSEMLVRLNSFGSADEMPVMKNQLDKAFKFMGREIIKEVEEMKRLERKGHKQDFPSFTALRWLYLCALDGRELPGDVQRANAYLMPLLKKDIHRQSLYEKAMTAVILSQSDAKRAKEYVKSLKEYTVYREEMGRYYDAPRAGYSWFDYRIPTQTMAIEALKRITPDDGQTISEMQRWLLQEKRTQAWDTPINSVNAVYAFLPAALVLDAPNAALKVDGKELAVPKATAALGYVKTPLPADGSTLTIEKTTGHTSWGAVYAQFVQPTTEVAAQRSGISVKREILLPKEDVAKSGESLSVGQRIVVRITIDSERDLDFVQVQDRRAACMEPVEQLSGYRNGAYCAPKDNATSYYFDCLRKGRHVIETEYYLDRAGSYETGTCIVQCAYAPEYRATAPASVLKVKK